MNATEQLDGPRVATDAPRVRRAGLVLVVVCLAQFMVILDISIVNVALPSIRGGLRFSTTGLQWVVNAYTLTFAGFLMLGGRLADLLGRRRVFLVGTGLFAVASLLCAVASSRGLLIGARALQGLGGAVVSPATMSIITTSFKEGSERNRALGAWGAMGALGASSGVLLGGVLTQGLGWPAIFAVNAPLGALIVFLGLRVIPVGSRRANVKRHFDVAGALLVTAGLVGVTYGIVRTDTLGWGSAGVLLPLAAGLALLGAFVLVEARFAQDPLIPLAIFRLPLLRGANIVVVFLYGALFAMWFVLTLYLQQVLGDSALAAGMSFVPMTLSVFAGSTLAPRLIGGIGARATVTAGMLSAGVGMMLLTGVRPGGTFLAQVLPGGVLGAFGLGLALVSATIVAMQGVPGAQSGLAAGLINTSRLVGGALGLAVLSTLAAAHTRGELSSGIAPLRAITDGYQLAFETGAVFCLAGMLAAVTLLRERPRRRATEAEPEMVAA